MAEPRRFTIFLLIALIAVLGAVGAVSVLFPGLGTGSAPIPANRAVEAPPVVFPVQVSNWTQPRFEGVVRSRALLSGSVSIVTMDASAETQRRFEGVEAAERINEELMRRRRQEWERTYRLRQEGRQ